MIGGHEFATTGEIAVGGVRVTTRRQRAAIPRLMFQNYASFPHLNCIDNVAFSLKMRRVAKAERRAMALDMLRLVEMVCTAVVSFLASLAFRRRFVGAGPLFYLAVASLVMPSVVVGLGIGALLEPEALQTAATPPVIYALDPLTTGLSLLVIARSLVAVLWARRRRTRFGSDAGQRV
jgi:hypothetical protein